MGIPAGCAEFLVGDCLVGPATFGVWVGRGGGRSWSREFFTEAVIGFALSGGLVVGDVVESEVLVLDEVENGAGRIIAVDLVEDADAKLFVVGVFEGGFSREKFAKNLSLIHI